MPQNLRVVNHNLALALMQILRYVASMEQTSFAKWRERMGITQSQAADMLGVGLRTVQHWEAGETSAGAPSYPPRAVRVAMAVLVKDPKAKEWPE
jgi:DNA-binding transcriptional regulator YiaG